MPVIAKIGSDIAISVIAAVATSAILKAGETIWKLRRRPKVTVLN